MRIRRVPIGHGWQWIARAFRLLRTSALTWILLALALLLVGLGLIVVPVVGSYLAYLLTPLFLGGLMLACRDQVAGGMIEIGHLFAGFRHNASQLVTVGGVYLVGQVLVVMVTLSLGGPELRELIVASTAGMDPDKIAPEVASRASFALLVGSAMLVPLGMAVWFAPALVVLDNVRGLRALQLSIQACLANVLPFLLYGAIMFCLLVLALAPLLAGLVLWVPLAVISSYTSYEDVFAREIGGASAEQ